MKAGAGCFLGLLLCLLAGCPQGRPPDADQRQAGAAPGSGGPPAPPPAGDSTASETPPEVPPAPGGSPKQLILVYTGDTLSILSAREADSREAGGLSALAATITGYEAEIVEYNRLRVLNEGGDATAIRADLDRGLLGEHPFILLDYGGWARPNDAAGAPLVALYLRMFTDLHFTAVGCLFYDRLPPECWDKYRERDPAREILVSAGQPQGTPLPRVPIVTREVHGRRWGIVCVPLPMLGEGTLEEITEQATAQIGAYVDTAAATLEENECRHGILLAAAGPASLYRQLAQDTRFLAVIGAPRRLAAAEGYGELPAGGALLLPELDSGGREIGVCHFYYTEGGAAPLMYYFSLKPCLEDPDAPYPYRRQVAAALEEYDALVAEVQAAATIPGP